MTAAIPAEAFDHGDARRYRRGCQCQPCVKAVSAETRRREYLRATGRGTLTTPNRAAAHIQKLRVARMSDLDIMSAANLSPEVFYRIIGAEGRIRRTTEHRVLGVTATETATGCGSHIPALGTVRRLRALAADGWTATELGRRTGKHKQFIVSLQNSEPTQVRRWVADYVRELCTSLKGLTPEEAGVAPLWAARARALAAKKGWSGTGYWDEDEYDDPDFTPATSDRITRNDLAAIRRAEVEHLISFGLAEGDIASRLNMAPSTVRAIVAELRTGQRRDRQVAA